MVNLRVAPVGSIGDSNLRFGAPHFVSAVLLIGGETSMLRQNVSHAWREAVGPAITWGYLADMHPFEALNEALFAAARTSEASVPVLEENR